MRKLKLLLMACALLGASQTWAQTDVTSTYITNAGFDESSDFQTGNVATGGSNQRKAVTGWTNTGGDTYTTGAAIGFGTSGQINGANLPSTNSEGTATGGALCLNTAWQSSVWYSQDVTLPAGNYTMTFKVNNVGQNAQFEKDPVMFSFTTTDGSSFSGNVHSYPVNTWTTQTITFALAAETTGTIKIGYKAGNTGSGNTPKLVVDNVKAMYNSNYRATLQSAIDRATILNARASDADLAAAITTAQGVLDAADNTVAYQTTIDNAVTTLRSAISTAAANVVLLEGENITFMFENADFESGIPVTGGITTYDYDAATNGTSFSRMQVVEGWTIFENGNAKSAGVYQFNSGAWLGSTGANYQAPASGSATGEEKALGIVAVWSSSAQYKQDCTLPAGSYIIEVPIYNTAGTTAFTKNLIGFVENGGTEHLATAKTYATGSWTTEKVIFELENETTGYLSLGYTAANKGSADMPHLFIDGVKVTYTSPIAAAYQKYQVALQAAQDAIVNSDYVNVTGDEKTALQDAIDATPEQTKEAYNTAADGLDAAREAFTGAKANYDAFVAAKGITAPTLSYAATNTETDLTDALAATATSSEDAATKTAAITTALRAYYESHAMAEGVAEAVDYSSAVAAANAETNTGWTNGVGIKNGDQPYTNSDGTTSAKYLDGGWAANSACNVDMTRSVEIPAGQYLLTVKARGAQDLTEYTLSIAGKTINLPHANGGSNGVFGNGWEDASIEFESDGTAQTLEVIAKSEANQQWFSMNDFRLVQLEANNDAYAGATEYAALNVAIEAAEAKTLGFEDGEFAPYNNIAALEALAVAKAIDQTAELTNYKTVVEAVTTTLTEAQWTANSGEVSAIDLFAIYDATNVDTSNRLFAPGWGKAGSTDAYNTRLVKGSSGNAGMAAVDNELALFTKFGTTYGEDAFYTMPLKANTVYKLSFKFGAFGENKEIVSHLAFADGDGNAIAITPESFTRANNSGLANASTEAWFDYAGYFKTNAAGDYVLTLTKEDNNGEQRQIVMGNIELKKAVAEAVTIAENADYTPAAKYANVTFNRTFAVGWNGAVLPFDMTVDEVKSTFNATEVKDFSGVTVNDDGSATLDFTDATDVKAGKPFVMKNSAGSSYTINGVILPATGLQTVEKSNGNVKYTFTGSYDASTDLTNVDFALINGGKFYYHTAADAKPSSAKAFRAWFVNESTDEAGSRISFNFGDDVITGINEVQANGQNTEAVYNLQGQRVVNAKKGLFIQNGKKIVRK